MTHRLHTSVYFPVLVVGVEETGQGLYYEDLGSSKSYASYQLSNFGQIM